jgi:hypothetical protein
LVGAGASKTAFVRSAHSRRADAVVAGAPAPDEGRQQRGGDGERHVSTLEGAPDHGHGLSPCFDEPTA